MVKYLCYYSRYSSKDVWNLITSGKTGCQEVDKNNYLKNDHVWFNLPPVHFERSSLTSVHIDPPLSLS